MTFSLQLKTDAFNFKIRFIKQLQINDIYGDVWLNFNMGSNTEIHDNANISSMVLKFDVSSITCLRKIEIFQVVNCKG